MLDSAIHQLIINMKMAEISNLFQPFFCNNKQLYFTPFISFCNHLDSPKRIIAATPAIITNNIKKS